MKSVILLHRARSIKRRAILFALGTQLCFLPGSAVCAFGQWNARAEFNATELELAASPYASGIGPVSGRVDIHAPIKERLLMGFENNSDGEELMSRQTAHLKLFASSDYGVSQGRQSARVIATQKDSYAEFVFPAAMMKGWEGFDFLALDIHVEQKRRFELHVEFRDARSRDYHSRCTLTQGVRNGSQTLLFPIALLRRNGKEGLDESELRPDDLIPHAALREVKLFFETDNGKLPVFWLDQVRLLNREALSTPMPLDLPAATALAVNFGSRASSQPNFDACFAAGGIHDSLGFKVESSTGIIQGGSAWPDGLCGSFLMASDSGILRFTVPLSNGVYRVLLLAGPVICSAPRHYRYLLKLNDQTLIDDLPDRNRIDGRDYLHRFMWTAYSERRDGLFLDYIERMYPVYKTVLTVHDGTLMIAAKNCFVSALVAIPEANKDDAGRFAAKLRLARARAFEQQTPWPFARAFDAPAVTKDDVALDVFLPRPGHAAHPKMTAQASDRAMGMIRKVLAPGQNLFARFCLRPDTNMGWVELQLSDGVGKRSSIGHAGAKLYFSNYRYAPDGVREGGLLPTDHVYLEPRITQTCHVWWPIPANTSPGVYMANIDILKDGKKVHTLLMEIEVSAIQMPTAAPGAFGFYYQGRSHPLPEPSQVYKTYLSQFGLMRALGFTSVTLPGVAYVAGVDANSGKVSMRFDDNSIRAAHDAGLGQDANQPLLLNQLNIARAIARRLPDMDDGQVEREPGIELKHPAFKPLWMSAMGQYRNYLSKNKGAYVFEVIDEPREHPNPWNRNLDDSMVYGKWMGEIGLQRFVTLMGDRNGGRDYMSLVEVVDVVSVHLNESTRGLQKRALAEGKTLWFFNAGTNRKSWGFNAWDRGASGRFEWHWCWPGDPANNRGGYPGEDWHNPFTQIHGLVPNAPPEEMTGGLLLNSALFDAADGIIDYTFVRHLERLLERHDPNQELSAYRSAQRQLKEIHDAISRGDSNPDTWRRMLSKAAEALSFEP